MKLLWLFIVLSCLSAFPYIAGLGPSNLLTPYSEAPNVAKLFVTTRSNPNDPQEIEATDESVENSHFNYTNPVICIIHDRGQCSYSTLNQDLSNAYLLTRDYNMIHAVWCDGCAADCLTAAGAVKKVGILLANFINFLTEKYPEVVHVCVLGVGVGAIGAGQTSRNLIIPAFANIFIDPSKCGSSDNDLNSTYAKYIVTFHTNCGTALSIGDAKPFGDCNFYFNNCNTQPGCSNMDTGECSHNCAATYLALARSGINFPAKRCFENQSPLVAGECNGADNVSVNAVVTGKNLAKGIYTVEVDKSTDYCASAVSKPIKYVCTVFNFNYEIRRFN